MVTASIIITTYQRPELFKRALKSAQNQTYKDYEIIVVDDHSTEEYRAADLPIPTQYIRHKTNKGLSAARNTGIKAARGKYIVCLDDDNELMPEFLEVTIKSIESNDIQAVGTSRFIKYKHFEDVAYTKPSLFSSIDWGWLIKREVFDEILYDEELRANEDTDFGIRFTKRYRSNIIHKPVLARAYDTENSLSFPDERELDGMEKFIIKNAKEYEGHPDEMRAMLRLMGRKVYRGGYRWWGIKWFWQSFRAKPGFNSFLNLFFILFGWTVYNAFMTTTEFIHAKLKL